MFLNFTFPMQHISDLYIVLHLSESFSNLTDYSFPVKTICLQLRVNDCRIGPEQIPSPLGARADRQQQLICSVSCSLTQMHYLCQT